MTDMIDPSSEDPELRLHLSRLPRHDAPPALMASLRRRYMGPSWIVRLRSWFAYPLVLRPAGLAVAACLMAVLWFTYQKNNQNDSIEIEPLLAAHTMTQSDSLVPDSYMTAADFSTQLASYYERN
jgi:hypothetical protein